MSSQNKYITRLVAYLLIVSQYVFAPMQAMAGISNLPPLVKTNVPPNVFYTLDDSGSMMFEVLPDGLHPIGVGTDTITRSLNRWNYSRGQNETVNVTWARHDIFSYCAPDNADPAIRNVYYYYNQCWVQWGFPQPADVYGGGNYGGTNWSTSRSNGVVGFGDNITVARWRSSSTNSAYYNPAIRYAPWIDSNITNSAPYGNPMAAATPTAAKWNPVPTATSSTAVINLTIDNTAPANWLNDTADDLLMGTSKTYYPATYYVFQPRASINVSYPACTGANILASNLNCYTKVEVKSAITSYSKATSRTDCITTSNQCSYAEEMQNFANWFQYYRSRILMARGSSGSAFAKQSTTLRVGFGTINDMDKNSSVLTPVTNDFLPANKKTFLETLYKTVMPTAGTPLRKAVDFVGQYFMDRTVNGPWQTQRGVGDASTQLTCRQNYNILMTDGAWNGTAAGSGRTGDWDSKDGSTMTGPNDTSGVAKTFKYIAAYPYKDTNSDSLADIAMYYWVNDLRSDWNTAAKKNVPTTSADPAFWQHLVQYTVGLGVVGTLNPAVDLPDLTTGTKLWPTASTNQVDDLWHAAVNTRGKYFSAANPEEFSYALDSALKDISSRSGDAAAIATSNNTLGANVKLYTSSYQTGEWSGRLEQKSLNATTGAVITPNDWDTNDKIPAFASRTIATVGASGTGGVNFTYANLSSANQSIFDYAASTYSPSYTVSGSDMVDYLKGDRSKELMPFRKRTVLLGDLVNSDPQYVGEGKDGGYLFLPTGMKGKSSYGAFLTTKKTRTPMVYVGSNDGMLHAFEATNSGSTKGVEKFAYIPNAVIPNMPALARPNYTHQFYVDAPAMIADAAIGSDPSPWRTVLVGGTGAGGKSIFALDVTDPNAFDASKVLWEKNSTLPSTDNDLGYTIGVAQIGQMRDGKWVAVFGNGYQSTNGKAVLYVVDLANGNTLFKVDTGVGSNNGLATPKLQLAADSTIKAVYAGDIKGNLWKFDFVTTGTSALTTTPQLSVAYGGSRAMFTTTSSRPITTQPQIYPHPTSGVMVIFGTGKIFEDSDPATSDQEKLYGVWDKPSVSTPTVTGTDLQAQTLSSVSGGRYYKVAATTVDWATKKGWSIAMNITNGERLVNDPIIFEEQAIFTTLLPGNTTDPCTIDGKSTTIQVSAINGAPLSYKTIDTNGDGVVDSSDDAVSGRVGNATFGTTIIRTGNRNIQVYQADSKTGVILGAGGNGEKGKLSKAIPTVRLWRQISGQ